MPKSVLVVDDEPDQRNLMREILELLGHQVMTASNGQEALHILDSGESPGLILLDITMPIMSGREFLTIFRSGSYPHLQDIPIVIISAVADRTQLLHYGCVEVITKPAPLDLILNYADKLASDPQLP